MGSSVPESFPVRQNKLTLNIKVSDGTDMYLEYLQALLVNASLETIKILWKHPTQNQLAMNGVVSHIYKGNKTDVVICSYDDQFLVIATQIGSMGTIVQARKEEGVSIDPTFNVSVIFGKRDEPMLVACARQLIEHISSSGSSKPLVLSLGLKDHSTETMKGIVSAVIENRLW